jgi:hypothetical protein
MGQEVGDVIGACYGNCVKVIVTLYSQSEMGIFSLSRHFGNIEDMRIDRGSAD